MKNYTNIFIRIALLITMFMHSVPSIISLDVILFGKEYLDKIGFAPFGVYLAWSIKIIHILTIYSLISNKFTLLFGWLNISILLVGIYLIHYSEGWFVVGNGRNGMEFNFVLIMCFLHWMYNDLFYKKRV